MACGGIIMLSQPPRAGRPRHQASGGAQHGEPSGAAARPGSARARGPGSSATAGRGERRSLPARTQRAKCRARAGGGAASERWAATAAQCLAAGAGAHREDVLQPGADLSEEFLALGLRLVVHGGLLHDAGANSRGTSSAGSKGCWQLAELGHGDGLFTRSGGSLHPVGCRGVSTWQGCTNLGPVVEQSSGCRAHG